MSFGDELRNTKPRTEFERKQDSFRSFVRNGVAGQVCAKIKPACVDAADRGKRQAVVELRYFTHRYRGVNFDSDVRIGFIRRRSLYDQILYEETSTQILEYCKQLDIQFVGISGQHYTNGDSPSEYVIRAVFVW